MHDPCLTNGIAPLTVPNLTAKVLVSTATHSFSTTTDCGPGTFSLVQSYGWLTLTQASGTATISASPTSNSNQGTFTLTMKTTLVNYPSVSVGDSTFTVTIQPNLPPVFATAPVASHSVARTQVSSPWAYAFPSATDPENNTITVAVNVGTATFVTSTSTGISIADLSNL